MLVTVKKMRGFAALHDARCAVARKSGGFKEFAGAAVSGGQPDLADLKAADVEDGEGVLYKSATNTAVLRFRKDTQRENFRAVGGVGITAGVTAAKADNFAVLLCGHDVLESDLFIFEQFIRVKKRRNIFGQRCARDVFEGGQVFPIGGTERKALHKITSA